MQWRIQLPSLPPLPLLKNEKNDQNFFNSEGFYRFLAFCHCSIVEIYKTTVVKFSVVRPWWHERYFNFPGELEGRMRSPRNRLTELVSKLSTHFWVFQDFGQILGSFTVKIWSETVIFSAELARKWLIGACDHQTMMAQICCRVKLVSKECVFEK